jgi:hypothetical protein
MTVKLTPTNATQIPAKMERHAPKLLMESRRPLVRIIVNVWKDLKDMPVILKFRARQRLAKMAQLVQKVQF